MVLSVNLGGFSGGEAAMTAEARQQKGYQGDGQVDLEWLKRRSKTFLRSKTVSRDGGNQNNGRAERWEKLVLRPSPSAAVSSAAPHSQQVRQGRPRRLPQRLHNHP